MSERTFAANVSKSFSVFSAGVQGEFLNIGADLFESEEVINRLYEAYVPLCANTFVSSRSKSDGGVSDIGQAYLNGFYMPCTNRTVLLGQVDRLNDELPLFAGLLCFDNSGPFYTSVRSVQRTPIGVVSPGAGSIFSITCFWRKDRMDRGERRKVSSELNSINTHTTNVVVMKDGRVLPCIDKSKTANGEAAIALGLWSQIAAVTINSWVDKRHLWQVATSESILFDRPTPIMMGVDEERIKSLFFARSLPTTDEGRKRPILHWVRAHQRRLREGIDIDIRKHLRGIEEFEMGGFQFQITNPTKAAVKLAA